MPSTKHQDQGRRMNEWVRATNGALEPDEAQRLIRLHLDEALPATALLRRHINDLHDGVMVSLDQGFAVGAELTVRIERDGAPVPGFGSEHADCVALPQRVTVGLSWSGTTRTVAEAAASIALYQLLLTAAAGIEAHFGRARITRIVRVTVPESGE